MKLKIRIAFLNVRIESLAFTTLQSVPLNNFYYYVKGVFLCFKCGFIEMKIKDKNLENCEKGKVSKLYEKQTERYVFVCFTLFSN